MGVEYSRLQSALVVVLVDATKKQFPSKEETPSVAFDTGGPTLASATKTAQRAQYSQSRWRAMTCTEQRNVETATTKTGLGRKLIHILPAQRQGGASA